MWLFLAVPVIAFGVSAAKTYKDSVDAEAAKDGARREADAAERRRLTELRFAEGRRSQELKLSEDRRKQELKLSDTKRKQELELAEFRRLSEASSARARLDDTRRQLSEQSQINLITSLAHGPVVREGRWWLELNASSRDATNLLNYLVSGIPEVYRSLIKLEIEFKPFVGLRSLVELSMNGAEVKIDHPLQEYEPTSPPATFELPRFLQKSRWRDEDPSWKSTTLILVQAVGEKEIGKSAAVAFRDLSRRGEIGSMTLKFEKSFPSRKEVVNFMKQHPDAGVAAKGLHGRDEFTLRYAIPNSVAKHVGAYWRQAITSSSVNLYLNDTEAYLMISSKAKLGKINIDEMEVSATFVANSEPKLERFSISLHHSRSWRSSWRIRRV